MTQPESALQARLSDRRWLAVGLHLLVVLAIVATRPAWQDASRTLIFGGALMLLACILLGTTQAGSAPLWLSPLSIYFFWYTVGLGLSAIYYGVQIGEGKPVGFYGGNLIDTEDVADGYVIYLLGSVALHAGIQFSRPSGTVLHKRVALDQHYFLLLVAIWAAGVWLAWRSDIVASFGALAPLITGAPMAAVSCLALLDHRDFRLPRPAYYAALLLGTGGLLVASFNSGSKATIMFSLIPLAWHAILRLPRARWYLPLGLLAVAGLYFWLVGPLVTVARMTAIQEGEVGASGQRIMRTVDDILAGRSDLNSADEGYARLANFLERQYDALPVGFIAGDVAQHGFDMGASMDYAAYAFVPHFLWPDKPPVTRGSWFAVYVGAAKTEATSTVAVGETAIGELYWNFGIPGVAAGMMLIGCALGLLWRIAGADPRVSLLNMLLYVTLMLTVISMAEAVSLMASIVAIAIAYTAALIGIKLLHSSVVLGHSPAQA